MLYNVLNYATTDTFHMTYGPNSFDSREKWVNKTSNIAISGDGLFEGTYCLCWLSWWGWSQCAVPKLTYPRTQLHSTSPIALCVASYVFTNKNKQTPWLLVRERTIPTDRPPLVDEI
jgi:hypothetical protein